MTIVLGCDRANYQAPWRGDYSRALASAGHRFSIIGRQRVNASARDQAAFDAAAGVNPIGEYLMNVGGAWPTPFATTQLIAIDVEPGSEFATEADIDNALLWVRSQGKIPVIYSSAWAWGQLGLDSLTKYGEQGIWLWDANYDGRCDGFELPRAFGGWTHCVIDQFTEHGQVAGVPYELDIDEFEPAIWGQLTGEGVMGADIRNGVDVGLPRLDLEAAGPLLMHGVRERLVAQRQAAATQVNELTAAIADFDQAWPDLAAAHQHVFGDGDLIRAK